MKFYNYIITLWVQIRDLYLYVIRRAIVVNGYVDDHSWRGIRHRNWGDDLNYYFLRKLTGRSVVFYHTFKLAKLLHLRNHLCIGTILDAVDYANAQTIVWGSGVSGQERSFVHPGNILSVRGRKTKEFCDRYKVKCPKVYGDPALLLPHVYQPKGWEFQDSGLKSQEHENSWKAPEEIEDEIRYFKPETTHYHLGIIPHVVDLHHPIIEEIRKNHADEILIIDLAHYDKWTDVIDQICSCERILSSSLHGIITSDAYGVPNCWIELTGKISGGHFKYYDYASSVDRQFDKPIQINKTTNITNLADSMFSCADREKVKELQQGLLAVAPFKCRIEERLE
jgi:pyruvyltransferase